MRRDNRIVKKMKANGGAFIAYSLTDVGNKRKNNEDRFIYRELKDRGGGCLMAVADGMGGHRGGEYASSKIVEVLEEHVLMSELKENPVKILCDAIAKANRSIYEKSKQAAELRGMGSTCTAALFFLDKVYIAHVGDSRAYLIRRNKIKRLTKDHTVAERLVESGLITPEQARTSPERNVLLSAVGVNTDLDIDAGAPIEAVPEDTLLLCSDGLTEFIRDDELAKITSIYHPEKACHTLVNIAKNRGGTDNITVQIARIKGKGSRRLVSGGRNIFTRTG